MICWVVIIFFLLDLLCDVLLFMELLIFVGVFLELLEFLVFGFCIEICVVDVWNNLWFLELKINLEVDLVIIDMLVVVWVCLILVWVILGFVKMKLGVVRVVGVLGIFVIFDIMLFFLFLLCWYIFSLFFFFIKFWIVVIYFWFKDCGVSVLFVVVLFLLCDWRNVIYFLLNIKLYVLM